MLNYLQKRIYSAAVGLRIDFHILCILIYRMENICPTIITRKLTGKTSHRYLYIYNDMFMI